MQRRVFLELQQTREQLMLLEHQTAGNSELIRAERSATTKALEERIAQMQRERERGWWLEGWRATSHTRAAPVEPRAA